MSSLYARGLSISKNAFFHYMLKRAPMILSKPLSVGILLKDAYQKLAETKGDKPGLQHVKDTMMTFLRMAKAVVTGEYKGIGSKSLLIGVATLLYFLSPIDLVPDFIPILGLADDFSLMAWFIDSITDELTKFESWEANIQLSSGWGNRELPSIH